MKIKFATAGVFLALGASALIAGCSPAADAPKTDAAATPAAPVVKPVFSINELMVMMVDQPGELLWNAEHPGKGPKTTEDWYQLQNHAVAVASAGTLIQVGGTGPKDAEWVASPQWQGWAQNMITAALAARTAAKAKDLPALITANGQIVEACEGCHKQFKPDLPTGNLFLHHPAT